MKFALHTVSYAGCWKGQFSMPLEAAIEKAASLGYKGVEIMAKRPHASVLDMDSQRIRRVKTILDDNGLDCACIAGYTDFLLGIDSMLVPSIEMQISHIERLAEMACGLGGNLVRVFTGYEVSGHQYWPQWYTVAEALRECGRRLAPMGVTLGLQNHHDIGADPEGMIDLLQDIGEPNVKAMYDAWTPALHGGDVSAAARRMAPYMVYTTAADYVRMPRWHYEPSLT
ncbi:MAG: sugar phosphate isomerase/epimerase, partial [Treponema sp.]|nr:sugar phosphate isomerase/epimerase [Treponema sp.]